MKKHILTFEEFINECYLVEGNVKQFEVAMKNLINNVRAGYGWIDPEYVYDAVVSDVEFDDFEWNTIKDEVYQRLIDQNLLYYANDADPEVQGQRVTKINQIKESVNETSDQFVNATLVEDVEDLRKGSNVKIDSLDFTKRGDEDKITCVRPDGNKMEILKKNLTVKL